jgi:teichuronic acid biosynthesis glycosyltransferase TuaC
VKIVTFGTLYPDLTRPHHGVFVEQRLMHLLARGGIEAKVVAPVPYFPLKHRIFGDWAALASVPEHEMRSGISVDHPRFLVIPRIGMTLQPRSLAAAGERTMRRLIAGGFDFDLIDAQYFYPDGVAAIRIGARLHKPVVITARGTDLNLIPEHDGPRRMIQDAARRASGLVTVCQALKDVLVDLGTPPDRVTVLRNGVDLDRFRPVDREAARRTLGFSKKTLLSVGHLIPRKGHDIAIRALAALPDFDLVIAGTGPEQVALESLATSLGAGRVRFAGRIPPEDLRNYYTASDALVLASDREGWANVLLESMACGTPVVATNVWGTPEVVTAPEAGVLMTARTPEALADAVHRLFSSAPDRAATRRYAEGFSWDATAEGLERLFVSVAASGKAAPTSASRRS